MYSSCQLQNRLTPWQAGDSMSVVPKWRCTIKDGKLSINRPDVFEGWLRSQEGKPQELVVKPQRDDKTMSQLAYFHGVICKLLSDYTGYTLNETKGLCKGHFLTTVVRSRLDDKEIAIVPSLADLSKHDMSEFIDNCVMLAAKLGVVIPPPSEIDF